MVAMSRVKNSACSSYPVKTFPVTMRNSPTFNGLGRWLCAGGKIIYILSFGCIYAREQCLRRLLNVYEFIFQEARSSFTHSICGYKNSTTPPKLSGYPNFGVYQIYAFFNSLSLNKMNGQGRSIRKRQDEIQCKSRILIS